MPENSTAPSDLWEEAAVAEGVHLFRADVIERVKARSDQAVRDIQRLRNNPPKSIHVRLQMYDNAVSALLDLIELQGKNSKGLLRERKQDMGSSPQRGGRRWSEDEDAVLIERAAAGDSVQQLANAFGRTPLAVSGRISHLVGLKRISENIAGQISGYLNGAEVSGHFVGSVRK